MERSGAQSYVYAKASGILARSFIGQRAVSLFNARSIPELWSLVLKTEVPSVPETLLAKRFEEEAGAKLILEYKRLLDMYDRPDEVAVLLLRYFDYSNLKSLGAAAAMGQKERPSLRNIAPYNILNYDGWPSIKKITELSPLSWYDKEPEISEQQFLDAKIDRQFVFDLWKAASRLGVFERASVEELILKKYAMRNMVWALRLKVFYKMSRDEILEHISFLNPSAKKDDLLAHDAIEILEKDPEHYEEWIGWKSAKFLNAHEEGSIWTIDPGWVEDAAQKELVAEANRLFHAKPFEPVVLVSWFFIKLHELNNIRAAVEALRLNVGAESAMEAAGIR